MSGKTTKTIGWILTIVLALFFGLTGMMKIMENSKIIEQTAAIGIDAGTARILGLIEILSLVLFVVPRTGIVGALLLMAYMGGVIATALQHHQPMVMFIFVEALIWVGAVLRFPELGQRLKGAQ
ncbi:DoxX family protein [Dinghuibacter silviterrae]|uniref:DoxX-like protein n=1 Tax=Dinghuibacter silviterrae TaxID=1539049 RepID=A0A4R8DUQ3_9BACT|nr:DoxX family protein [Dinghuibacter silviterrae]TDX02122.1 DoxX-like protein [Dinghuibacter silviterrae]